jgi:hypothetical protein
VKLKLSQDVAEEHPQTTPAGRRIFLIHLNHLLPALDFGGARQLAYKCWGLSRTDLTGQNI